MAIKPNTTYSKELAGQRLGAGLARPDKLQASGPIDELPEGYGGRGTRGARPATTANGGGGR